MQLSAQRILYVISSGLCLASFIDFCNTHEVLGIVLSGICLLLYGVGVAFPNERRVNPSTAWFCVLIQVVFCAIGFSWYNMASLLAMSCYCAAGYMNELEWQAAKKS